MGSAMLMSFRLFPLLLFFLASNLAEEESPEVTPVEKPKPSFVAPKIPDNAYLALYFTSPSDLQQKLTTSQAKKDGADESIAKYDGIWAVEVPQTSAIDEDFALILKSKAKHHAIASKLNRPIKFDTNELVIQYEVKFEEGMECGGAYIKLLSSDVDLKNFNDKTPYTIMFGPDKCGLDHKFHFIFRHKNPKTGEFEEKHAKKIKPDIERYFSDKKTHLYTLVLRLDNTFERYIDQVKVQSGSLLEDFEPPVNPPKEVDDPSDTKPADWDEREKIVDEAATKPDDWDEEAPEFIADESATKPSGWLDDELEMIPDPNAKIPEDWDPKIDGDWEAPKVKNPKCESAPGCGEWTKPLIRNPNFKGKWSPPLIPNPAYKGIWKPRKIPNPHFFEDSNPYRHLVEVGAVGLELWSMTDRIVFDNFLIVDSKHAADAFAAETWVIKEKAERMADPKAQSVVDAIKETYAEKPWLVFVIGLVCTLPILLCCVYVCRSPRDEVAVRKKTDARVPDDRTKSEDKVSDEEAEDEEEGEDVDEGSAAVGATADASGDDESESDKNVPLKESPSGDGANTSSAPMDSEPMDKQAVRKRRSRKE